MTKPMDKCTLCGRNENYFMGCSHVECPNRRPVTARISEKPVVDSDIEFESIGRGRFWPKVRGAIRKIGDE